MNPENVSLFEKSLGLLCIQSSQKISNLFLLSLILIYVFTPLHLFLQNLKSPEELEEEDRAAQAAVSITANHFEE